MRIDEVLKDLNPSSREEKVLRYIIQRSDEVFWYYDEGLKAAFPDIKESTLNWYLFNLSKNNKISKTRAGRYTYFGSKVAIEEFVKKLPKE